MSFWRELLGDCLVEPNVLTCVDPKALGEPIVVNCTDFFGVVAVVAAVPLRTGLNEELCLSFVY